MNFCQIRVEISDPSQVGEARREASRLGTESGMSTAETGKAAIIATELATNLSRHAQGGEILIRAFAMDGVTGLEIISIDRGPGMQHVAKCLEDGYSTAGTTGNGLGAVRRLATDFDIYSTHPGGTIILARVHQNEIRATDGFAWGVINRPAPREVMCGDTWRIAKHDGGFAVMVADGLGHGPLAFESADAAANTFERDGVMSPAEFLSAADQRMRGTRGAAVAVAQYHAGKLRYAGVGNIASTLRSRESTKGRGLVSHNGTVGVEMRRVQAFEYECPSGSLLIMHSDGLQSRWSLDTYPGILERHPALVASVLYRDYCRGRDDVTVCVVRCFHSTAA